MSISQIRLLNAPVNSTGTCPICILDVSQYVHRLGHPIIHSGAGGAKHPMHALCFWRGLKGNQRCPVCRVVIPITPEIFSEARPERKTGAQRIRTFALTFVIHASVQGVLTKLLGSSLMAAALPGVVCLPLAANNFCKEYRDLGFQSLRQVAVNDLSGTLLSIAIPVAGATLADRVTESVPIKVCLSTAFVLTVYLVLFMARPLFAKTELREY